MTRRKLYSLLEQGGNMDNLIQKHRASLKQKNYIRKADSNLDYWFDFSKNILEKYASSFGDQFNLILYGSPEKEGDFYVLPYGGFKHIFNSKHLAHDDRNRWIGTIRFNELRITNCTIKPDISAYYGNSSILGIGSGSKKARSDEEQNDYAIENRKAEINARQKQSLFRKRVLENFDNRCCLTGIPETRLLVASHIVPWADAMESRLDPKNGISLFVLYDKLFDEGYFSLSEDLKVVVTSKVKTLNLQLQKILFDIEGRKISHPLRHKLKLSYVEYHRKNKLIR
jgi:putative restriction endonuclease